MTKHGFTLIEVLVGMILVVIISLTGLGFLVHCERLLLKPELRLMAANFGRETIEGLYWADYTNLPEQTDTQDTFPPQTNFGEGGGTYNWTRAYSVASKQDYKLITVTVTYNR